MPEQPGSTTDPYFQQCQHCGQAVQVRQMTSGQWAAFDDAERIHDCRNQSAYNDTYIEATRTLVLPGAPAPAAPAAVDGLPTTTPLAVAPPAAERPPDVVVLPPARPTFPRAAGLLVLALILLAGGWLTSSRLGVRVVPSDLPSAAPTARANPRADHPAAEAEVPTSATSAATASEPGVVVERQRFDFIYVRTGPELAYPEVARIYDEQSPFTPEGRNADASWLFGTFADGTKGWVLAEFVLGADSAEALPVQEALLPEGVAAHITLQGYDFIYVQQGPTVEADEVDRLSDESSPIEALARSTDGEWLFVYLADGTPGWVMRQFVVSDSSLDLLPAYESHEIRTP